MDAVWAAELVKTSLLLQHAYTVIRGQEEAVAAAQWQACEAQRAAREAHDGMIAAQQQTQIIGAIFSCQAAVADAGGKEEGAGESGKQEGSGEEATDYVP